MGKELNEKELIGMSIASPYILKLLEPFTAQQLAEAIEKNIDIVDLLKQNPSKAYQLRVIIEHFPFFEVYIKKIGDERYVRYFI